MPLNISTTTNKENDTFILREAYSKNSDGVLVV